MASLEVNRSVRFVSLDTHPANNSLVVSYEIVVSIIDSITKRELSRRNKRDQLLINVTPLNGLGENDLETDKMIINLQELSSEILQKCPLLKEDQQSLEDIQLHLLYLVNRRQTQLLARANSALSEQPPSSASASRLRSAGGAGRRSSSGFGRTSRAGSAIGNSGYNSDSKRSYGDIYIDFHARELNKKSGLVPSLLDEFTDELDDRLTSFELSNESIDNSTNRSYDDFTNSSQLKQQLEILLEDLYGDQSEKLAAIAKLRRISKVDKALYEMSSNRLLIFALLRTLRDSNVNINDSTYLLECICFSLIRLTSFKSICTKMFADLEANEFGRILLDLFASHVAQIQSIDDGQLQKVLSERLNFFTRCLLMIMLNLMSFSNLQYSNGKGISKSSNFALILLNANNSSKLVQQSKLRQQTQQQQQQQATNTKQAQLASSLVDLLWLTSKALPLDLRLAIGGSSCSLLRLLAQQLAVLLHLSSFKEYTLQLRACGSRLNNQFVDSLILLLDTLQLSRPASGNCVQAKLKLFIVSDKQTLNRLYNLELDCLKLLANLMLLDGRIKKRLVKRNLLKCILRNVVVFLASRKSVETLSPFHCSPVLLLPFKCLYELTSDTSMVRRSLFKSKVIIKCLFEYLLSATSDLESELRLIRLSSERRLKSANSKPDREEDKEDEEQLVLVEASCASHYILAIWINLSVELASQALSPDSGKPAENSELADVELAELLAEYVELVHKNTSNFLEVAKTRTGRNLLVANNPTGLMGYLHLKLVRNLAPYLARWRPTASLRLWCRQLTDLTGGLFDLDGQLRVPMLVESLGTLAPLLLGGEAGIDAGLADRLMPVLLGELSACSAHEHNDDLLLVCLLALAGLARSGEICDSLQRDTTQRIATITCTVLESRASDRETSLSCLFALSQLMMHSGFVARLAGPRGELAPLAERLFAGLLEGDRGCTKLVSLILERWRQVSTGQLGFLLHARRFAAYNARWMGAIRAIRAEPSTELGGARSAGSSASLSSSASSGAGRRDFAQLRMLEPPPQPKRPKQNGLISAGLLRHDEKMGQSIHHYEDEENANDEEFINNEEDDDDYEDDDDDDDDGEEEEEEDEDEDQEEEAEALDGRLIYDLTVIDPKSMTEHLSDRRKFRAAR